MRKDTEAGLRAGSKEQTKGGEISMIEKKGSAGSPVTLSQALV